MLTPAQKSTLLEELFGALEGVTSVLSKFPDDEWAAVEPIQSAVNQCQETVNQLERRTR